VPNVSPGTIPAGQSEMGEKDSKMLGKITAQAR
jgi:hypothetical protein